MSVFTFSDLAFMGAAAGGLDPDAAAYIARVEGASGDNQALEDGVKTAINAFVVGCKADGIWNAIKASCIMAGARTLNGALQPLVGAAPTNIGFSAANYNRKSGITGNSAGRLNANINRNAMGRNDCHFAIWRTAKEPTNKVNWVIGAGSGGGGVGCTHYAVGSVMVFRHSSNAVDISAIQQPAAGLLGASRFSSSQYQLFANGVSTTKNLVSDGVVNASFFVFNTQDIAFESSSGSAAFYSIGDNLNLSLLNARVTALINAFAAAIP